MTSTEIATRVEENLKELVGLQLFKTWNVFATRMFYFAPRAERQSDDGDYRLTLECPWRIEGNGRVLVGSEDYGLRADDNNDPNWDPTEVQWGHRQDQKLAEILGEERNGTIFNTGAPLIVASVDADAFGGFQMGLTGAYNLSVFPTTAAAMEWQFSRRGRPSFSLSNGVVS